MQVRVVKADLLSLRVTLHTHLKFQVNICTDFRDITVNENFLTFLCTVIKWHNFVNMQYRIAKLGPLSIIVTLHM